MKEQLLWSRTINTIGRPGKNIPMDLHMEHLNRVVKDAMRTLSSNINEGVAVDRIDVPSLHGCHSARSSQKDLEVVVEELQKADIFSDNRRQHSHFPKCN
uniref:Uncharacterized protein n=1 Tax=Amphimedon queenslandica TaxID=400682 RepID=A0A1X7U352_AMPQE